MDGHPLNRPVFLSASEPALQREPGYWINRKLLNVREAVRAFCAHTMPHYPIVFGGHPAITPLVRQIAERIGHQDVINAVREERKPSKHRVVIFQSRHFVDGKDSDSEVFTSQLDSDGNWTGDKASGSRSMSLLRMRYEMIARPKAGPIFSKLMNSRAEFGKQRHDRLQTYEFAAAVFIGGMEGVEREFCIFRDFHPDTPAYPVASTGSVSELLLRRVECHLSDSIKRMLVEELAYGLLMHELLPVPVVADEPALSSHWRPEPHDNLGDPHAHVDPEEIQTAS